MDEVRKKHLKSIVAQRLILFSALEKGRPRTDDGSPVLSNNHQFIFNTGLSPDIISDIQKRQNNLKSTRYENQTLTENMTSHGATGGSVSRVPQDSVQPAFSVRHLRSIFESTSAQLTARNCLERHKIPVSSPSPLLLKKGKKSLSSFNDAKKTESCINDNNDNSICAGLLSASSKIIGSISQQEHLINHEPSKVAPRQKPPANSLPTAESAEVTPEESKTKILSDINNINTEKDHSVTQSQEYEAMGTQSNLVLNSNTSQKSESSIEEPAKNQDNVEKQDSLLQFVEPSFKVPSKTYNTSDNKITPVKQRTLGRGEIKPYEIVDLIEKGIIDDEEKSAKNQDNVEKQDNLLQEENPVSTNSGLMKSSPVVRRKSDVINSVYVEPSFKVPSKAYSTSDNKITPVKQRSLGRGEIKPYEIVDLVDKGSIDHEEKHGRMESIYVKMHEEKNAINDQDGYQTIPEYSEPDIGKDGDIALESNEFDLSNIDASGKESIDNPELTIQQHSANDMSGVVLRHPHRNSDGELSSGPSSLSSTLLGGSISCLSDVGEGWDTDEFEDFTDDDVLEEARPRAKTIDGDNTKKKVLNIVNEILTTEKAYEKRLHLLDQVFQARLMKEAKEHSSFPEKVIIEIFSNLSSIYTFHSTMLLPDLEKRIANWSSYEKIGDIFKTLGHCLMLYTNYVKNFDHATSTLNIWMKKSPKFASIVEDIQKLPECERLTLHHHMLEPIQRVPRYKLLLQDYLKKLPKDALDRAEAEESLTVISKAANHANNSMKNMDKFKQLVELEERIVDGLRGESLATASRVFIKEGELVKIAARSDQKNVRVLLLFNDLLLCCNKVPTSGKLKVKQIMDVPGMTLQDGSEVDVGEAHAFRVKSRQRVLDLAASSVEEKAEWMAAISKVIEEYEANRGTMLKKFMEEDAQKEAAKSTSMKVGQAAPVWVKDEDVTMCMLCAVRFSILIRRHHCRACGRIVCDNCSKYKANLSYINNVVKRVCYVCHRKLNVDKLQPTDSFMHKKTTIDRVARDIKRRRSTMVTEVNGDLLWKPPGKGWQKGWFAISDLVMYAHKGKKDPQAESTIALPGYTVGRPTPADEIDESKHPFVFKVHFGSKKELTHFFAAENETKMNRWIDVITYSIRAEKPPPSSQTL